MATNKLYKVIKSSNSEHFRDTDEYYDKHLGATKDKDSFYIDHEKTVPTLGDFDQSYKLDYLHTPDGITTAYVEYWSTGIVVASKKLAQKESEKQLLEEDSEEEADEIDDSSPNSKYIVKWGDGKDKSNSALIKNKMLADHCKEEGYRKIKSVMHFSLDITQDSWEIMQKKSESSGIKAEGITIEEILSEALPKVNSWLDLSILSKYCPSTSVVAEVRILIPEFYDKIDSKGKCIVDGGIHWIESEIYPIEGYNTREEAAEAMNKAAKETSELKSLPIITTASEVSKEAKRLKVENNEIFRRYLGCDPTIGDFSKSTPSNSKLERWKIELELEEYKNEYLKNKEKK